MPRILLACLIGILLLRHVAHGQKWTEPNRLLCSQVMDVQVLERCCGDEYLSRLPFLHSNCSDFKNNYGACRYDCFFNYWQLLNVDRSLNLDKVSDMIDKLYSSGPDNRIYGQQLNASFVHCSRPSAYNVAKLPPSVLHMMTAHRYNPREPLDCPRNAMKYTKCALAHVYLNCPPQHWLVEDEETGNCGASQRLTSHCVAIISRLLNSSGAAPDDTLDRLQNMMHSASVGFKQKRCRVRRWNPSTHWYTAFINWLVF